VEAKSLILYLPDASRSYSETGYPQWKKLTPATIKVLPFNV